MGKRSARYGDVLPVLEHLLRNLPTSSEVLAGLADLRSEEGTRTYLSTKIPQSTVINGSATQFCVDYFAINLLSKWKGLRTGYDLRRNAIEAWEGFEAQCKETNQRIRQSRTSGIYPTGVGEIISIAQRKISEVLGALDLHTLAARCRWSNGATSTTRRVPFAEKMSRPVAVTRRALPHLARDVMTDPVWLSYLLEVEVSGPVCPLIPLFEVVEEERFITVPKNAKTDRSIQAAPSGNAFLQQGVGRYIRSRLKRFGVDLDDQSRNQVMAADAFVTSALATLDLKGASDTLSRELVWLMLPTEWAAYLDDLRVPKTRIDGKEILLQKFSAMGNAFTFELESLVFWAISYAVHSQLGADPHHCSVYGDDIICDRSCYHRLVEVLSWFGFSVNTEKSFHEGYFFESCGKHYYHGCDVTPCYQKEQVRSLAELIRLHNRLLRWLDRVSSIVDESVRTLVLQACKRLRSLAGPGDIPRIPFGAVGDTGFLSRWETIKVDRVSQSRGVKILQLMPLPHVRASDNDLPYYAYKLRRPFTTYEYRKRSLMVQLRSERYTLRLAWYAIAFGSGNTIETQDSP